MATIASFLDAARSELGYTECSDRACPDPARHTSSNHTKFAGEAGHTNGYAWCATFLVALAVRVSLGLPNGSADCDTLAAGFKKRQLWGTSPRVGAFVFFAWNPDRRHDLNHVGVVEAINADGSITTIEANTSTSNQRDGGYVMRRRRSGPAIRGYGYPRYGEGAIPTIPVPITKAGTPMEVDDVRLVPMYHSAKTDNQGRANFTTPVPIDRIVGAPKSHSEVRPNVDGRYDPVPNTVACTPDELNGGPATTFVIQGDDPDSVFHLWWHEVAA